MIASTVAEAGSFSSKDSLPRTFLKRPRTYVTIMWRAQNSADVCPGSRTHFATVSPFPPGVRRGARLLRASVVIVEGGFFFQAEDGIRDVAVTGVQTCALPI